MRGAQLSARWPVKRTPEVARGGVELRRRGAFEPAACQSESPPRWPRRRRRHSRRFLQPPTPAPAARSNSCRRSSTATRTTWPTATSSWTSEAGRLGGGNLVFFLASAAQAQGRRAAGMGGRAGRRVGRAPSCMRGALAQAGTPAKPACHTMHPACFPPGVPAAHSQPPTPPPPPPPPSRLGSPPAACCWTTATRRPSITQNILPTEPPTEPPYTSCTPPPACSTLLDNSNPPIIKICDFGFAKQWSEDANMLTQIG